MNKDNLFDLYTLVQMAYEEFFSPLVQDKKMLYPLDWYGIRDYQEKIEIISEAIDKEILIKDTLKYKNRKSCVE